MNPQPTPRYSLPAVLSVLGYTDRVVEDHGYRPDDPYVERCWLSVIGPTSFLMWRALNRIIPPVSSEAVEVDAIDLVVSLGLGERAGSNSPGGRCLNRLAMFDFLYRAGREGAVIAVRRAVGPVPERSLSRLSYSARRYHEDQRRG